MPVHVPACACLCAWQRHHEPSVPLIFAAYPCKAQAYPKLYLLVRAGKLKVTLAGQEAAIDRSESRSGLVWLNSCM